MKHLVHIRPKAGGIFFGGKNRILGSDGTTGIQFDGSAAGGNHTFGTHTHHFGAGRHIFLVHRSIVYFWMNFLPFWR